jgi:hypothetical protein
VTSAVTQKGIAAPPSDELDVLHRDFIEVHGHGCTAPQGVNSTLAGLKPQNTLANGRDSYAQLFQDHLGCVQDGLADHKDCVHLHISCHARVAQYPFYQGSPLPDKAYQRVMGPLLSDIIITLVMLLILKLYHHREC